MKTLLLLIILIVPLLLIAEIADSLTVTVEVVNFENNDGDALLSVFTSKDGFPDNPDKAVKIQIGKIKNKTSVFKLKLPEGSYAFSVLHDENSNQQMDTTWYGKPTEGFGVSNNPRIRFRPPSFEDAKVKVNQEKTNFQVKLIYL